LGEFPAWGLILEEPWNWAFNGDLNLEGFFADQGESQDGALRLDLRNASLLGTDIELQDVSMTWVNELTPPFSAYTPEKVRIGKWKSGDYEGSDVEFRLGFRGMKVLELRDFSMSIFGGTLRLGDCDIDLDTGELSSTLIIDGVDIEKIIEVVPQVSGEARGRLVGEVPFTVNLFNPRLHFGEGVVLTSQEEPGYLKLALTRDLTEGLTPGSSDYKRMALIKEALSSLDDSALRVAIHPLEGDDEFDTRLELGIVGKVNTKMVKAPVDLQLNLNLPINELLNLAENLYAKLPQIKAVEF